VQFVCRVGTADGRVLTQVQEGGNEATLRRELERQGLHVFEIRPRGFSLSFSLPGSKSRRKPLKGQDFLAFNQELAALLRAGLPLLQSLDLMLERQDDPNFRDILTEVRDQVKSGTELSEAFAGFGPLFPSLYASTLKAGERSGELEQVLRRFIRYQQLVLDAQKKLVSALVYPAVLIGLSLVMILVLAIYVVPNFQNFYAELDAELPAITQATLAISFFLRDNFLWLAGGTALGVVALGYWRQTPKGRVTLDRWRLQIPLVGVIFHQFALAEFCRSLSTLLTGGIPLLSALDTAIEAVANAFVSHRLTPAIDDVRQGESFYAALEKTGVVPSMAIDMVKVGESTGMLDEMLSNVADYLDDQVEMRTQRLLSLLEPILMIIMGGLVSLLLISIYLPMFSALQQIR